MRSHVCAPVSWQLPTTILLSIHFTKQSAANMYTLNQFKEWVDWPTVRAHLCTLAVAMSFNNWWRVPRDAFRYGGISFGLVHTVIVVTVAMPLVLQQLAVGQISQQDVVGIWRAVPFFRGAGYLRLLITSLGSIYTIVYLALTAKNFLYVLSNYGSPELIISEDDFDIASNNSSLASFNKNMTVAVEVQPQDYLATALLVAALWILFPFVLYSPVKSMKRTFYCLGPLTLLLGVVIVSCIGNSRYLSKIQSSDEWSYLLSPDIWCAGLVQALWTTQVAGGYLVSTGDTLYSSANVEWTTLIITGMNIVSSWFCLLFWYSIGGESDKDQSFLAAIFQVYKTAEEQQLNRLWPLLVFTMLFFSGIITMLTLLYPLYDRFRRMGRLKWRVLVAVSSCIGTAASVTLLVGQWTSLHMVEDIATPLLISVTTVLEVSGFVFIYGRKFLAEDLEFLTGRPLKKFWMYGWYVALGVTTAILGWWVALMIIQDPGWTVQPWSASTLAATAGLTFIIFVMLAVVSVVRQVQYDFLEKLKSSFKPSRYWGPRDPIAHFYWSSRRENIDIGNSRPTCYRRRLGQFSSRPNLFQLTEHDSAPQKDLEDVKCRSNSDDWLYTVYRKQYLENTFPEYSQKSQRPRSKSFDWECIANLRKKYKKSLDNTEKKQMKVVTFEHEGIHKF